MGKGVAQNRDDPNFVDEWGKADDFASDSYYYKKYGGDQKTYEAMTPEERQQYRAMVAPGSASKADDFKNFTQQMRTSPHARPTVPDDWQDRPEYAGLLNAMPWMKNIHPGQGGAGGGGGRGGLNGPGDPYLQSAAPSVNSAWGGQETIQNPDGSFTVNNTLSGPMGQANDSLQAQWAQALQNPLDGNSARDQAIDSAYGQATSRLNPMWDKREEAQRTQLLNQGLDPTSEAGRSAMQDFGMQRNDAYTSALASAISQGTSAGDSVFRNNLAAQNNPLQQMGVLKGLSQTTPPSNLLNATIAKKNGELGLATAQMQQQTDMANGGMQLAGAGLNYLSNLGK